MKYNMIRNIALLVACALSISRAVTAEVPMIRLGGTPKEIGKTWGEMNKQAIAHDMNVHYLEKAAAAGISQATLIERSEAFVRIVEEIGPHWLEEAKAIARAAGVDETMYVAFIGGRTRNRFLHECTSYSISREHARGGAVLFHKTRDNVKKEQAAYILQSSTKGLNKFIAICDASVIGCSMMVNDKGLAGCGDYPANLTRKNDPSALLPEPAEPRYRGMMGGHFLRYIAERASSCEEALDIIEDFVKKGYYAGGTVNGQHWLLVDRQGVILEVSNNSRHVASRIHSKKVYFSRLDGSEAAKRLREASGPVDFHLFHNVSRDPSICLGSSISGMTVEIDPTHPETLTCAWISLPVRSVSFPLLMGQTKTPACLLNGEAYSLGTKIKGKTRLWEVIEQNTHASKELLKEKVAAGLSADKPERAAQVLDQWAQRQAEMLVEILQALQIDRIIGLDGTLEFRVLANARDHKSIIGLAEEQEGTQVLDDNGDLLARWVPVARGAEDGFPYPEIAKRTRVQNGEERLEILVVQDPFNVDGSYVNRARSALDQSGRPCIDFTFNSRGGRLFGGLTGNNLPEAVTGFSRKLGIILNGSLRSAPAIRSVIRESCQITGDFTEEEVSDLVSVFNSGSLPAGLRKVEGGQDKELRPR